MTCECAINEREMKNILAAKLGRKERLLGEKVRLMGEYQPKCIHNTWLDRIKVHKIALIDAQGEFNEIIQILSARKKAQLGMITGPYGLKKHTRTQSAMQVENLNDGENSDQENKPLANQKEGSGSYAAAQDTNRLSKKFRSLLLSELSEIVAAQQPSLEQLDEIDIRVGVTQLREREKIEAFLQEQLNFKTRQSQELWLPNYLDELEAAGFLFRVPREKNTQMFSATVQQGNTKTYFINVQQIFKVKRAVYDCIRDSGIKGATMEELLNAANHAVSGGLKVISKELIFQYLDDLHKKCLIYKSSPGRFNALQ